MRHAPPPSDGVERVRAELAALPVPPVPPELSARWAAALAAEAGRAGATAEEIPGRARHHRSAFRRRGPLLRTAVAAALLGVLVLAGVHESRPAPPLDGIELAGTGRAAIGATDTGALADPGRREGCLRAVGAPGVDPVAPLLGGRRVDLGGREGVLLVLASGERGVFRVVVVDPGCGPGGGDLLGATTVGMR